MKEVDTYDSNTFEQSAETIEPAHIVSRADLTQVHEHANALLAALEEVADGDMVGEIVANALKLLRDQTNRGDIMLISMSCDAVGAGAHVGGSFRGLRGAVCLATLLGGGFRAGRGWRVRPTM